MALLKAIKMIAIEIVIQALAFPVTLINFKA